MAGGDHDPADGALRFDSQRHRWSRRGSITKCDQETVTGQNLGCPPSKLFREKTSIVTDDRFLFGSGLRSGSPIIRGGLRNPADGLWWRDLHFTPGGGTQQRMTSALHDAIPGSGTDAYIVAPNGKELYWSRGSGWVMAALVRVLDWLPTSDSHRATYVADFKSIAASLIPLQRSDGFWNESLLDPTHCSTIGKTGQDGPETSGTALFTYGLAWGIRQGLLDDATYGAALSKAWNGLVTVALQSDGRLGYVQSTGDRPCTDTSALGPTKLANFDDYGVGAFLLAGSEVYSLLQ